MPKLVAGGVGFAENGDEEVPVGVFIEQRCEGIDAAASASANVSANVSATGAQPEPRRRLWVPMGFIVSSRA